MKKHKIAIFDIDGTIFRSSLTIELVEALIQEDVFPSRVRKTYTAAYQRWLDRKDSYEKYIGAVVDAYNASLKGVRVGAVMKVARDVVAFHKDRVYRYTRDLIRTLTKRKYYLIAISHSIDIIVHEFARELGFNKYYGRMFEIDARGRFTGEHLYEDLINDKAKLVKHIIKKNHWSLEGSIGVGDTESDIAFLKLVEQPICFNPNQKLYRYAKGHGWPIVVERKDVVYKLR